MAGTKRKAKGKSKPKQRKAKPRMTKQPRHALTDADHYFVRVYESLGPAQLAFELGKTVRAVQNMRVRLEQKLGRPILARNNKTPLAEMEPPVAEESARIDIPIVNGTVLVGSDGHYWPGAPTTAHRAFVWAAKELKPRIIVMNGDALDAPSISRHPPIGWESHPTLEEELAVVQERLGEIELAKPKGCRLVWPLGNHDARFNTRLASLVPQFRNIKGTRLLHHFPLWEPCWSVFLGGARGAVVKHRFKGGIHAPHNNTLWAGRTIVTGHLHSQKVIPLTDYSGTRWGVDCGTLSHSKQAQFGYTEDNPLNWRSGFAVLTWKNGELLPPELVTVWDERKGQVWFRGELVRV